MNAAIEDVYRLAPLQEGLLLYSVRDEDPTLFVNQLVCRLSGELSTGALAEAYAAITAAHPVLRTSFHAGALEHPVQVVRRSVPVAVREHDLRGHDDPEAALAALLSADRGRGFVLDRAPLTRVARVALDGHDVLVWTFHHLLLDGWSAHLVLDDLLTAYDAAARGVPVRVPRRRPYRDYIAWLGRQDPAAARECFRQRLSGLPGPTALPGDAPATDGFAEQRVTVPGHAWHAAARTARVTLSTLVQAAWGYTLARFTGECDVVFGTTLAVRPPELSGADGMVGVLLNTLPTRIAVDPDRPLGDWLAAVHAAQQELQQHGHLPLATAQAASGLPAGTPLFETSVVVENYPIDSAGWRRASIAVERVEYCQRNNFPLTLLAVAGDAVDLILSHDRARYSGDFARRLLDHVRLVLDRLARLMTGRPERRVGDLAVLPPADHAIVLRDRTEPDPPPVPGTIFGWAEAHPDHPAVIHDAETLSYADLAAVAAGVAGQLAAGGVEPGALVAVCVPPAARVPAVVLGVLAAGCAYVLVDHAEPGGVAVDAAVTTGDLAARLAQNVAGPVLCLDGRTGTGAPVRVRPSDPAHAWSTPDTRGAVLADHGALSAAAAEFAAACELTASDAVALPGASEPGALFGTLTTGATAVTGAPGEPTCLAGLTPHRLRALGHHVPVRTVVVDAAATGLDDRDRRHAAAVFGAAVRVVERYRAPGGSLGTLPRHGSVVLAGHILVLDPALTAVPVGAVGDLYVGGPGAAADVPAGGLVPNPYGRGRLYRTGDRGRWRPDGTVEILGRAAELVTIGRTRVDIAAVARAVRAHPSVVDAAAAVDGGGLTVAVATREPVDLDELRRVAATPVTIVPVDELPLTGDALDLAGIAAPAGRGDEPRTPEETALAAIFARILEVPRVGLHDSFFELGGSSLAALRMMTEAGAALGVQLPVEVLFESPTVAALAHAAGGREQRAS